MSPRYLLDTNAVSYAIQGRSAMLRKRMDNARAEELAISVFTQAELVYGLERKPAASRLRLAVESFLKVFVVLPWDAAAADAYGKLRAAQERKGLPLSHQDLMIASHALSQELILVTSDRAFAYVDGLDIEDWTAS